MVLDLLQLDPLQLSPLHLARHHLDSLQLNLLHLACRHLDPLRMDPVQDLYRHGRLRMPSRDRTQFYMLRIDKVLPIGHRTSRPKLLHGWERLTLHEHKNCCAYCA